MKQLLTLFFTFIIFHSYGYGVTVYEDYQDRSQKLIRSLYASWNVKLNETTSKYLIEESKNRILVQYGDYSPCGETQKDIETQELKIKQPRTVLKLEWTVSSNSKKHIQYNLKYSGCYNRELIAETITIFGKNLKPLDTKLFVKNELNGLRNFKIQKNAHHMSMVLKTPNHGEILKIRQNKTSLKESTSFYFKDSLKVNMAWSAKSNLLEINYKNIGRTLYTPHTPSTTGLAQTVDLSKINYYAVAANDHSYFLNYKHLNEEGIPPNDFDSYIEIKNSTAIVNPINNTIWLNAFFMFPAKVKIESTVQSKRLIRAQRMLLFFNNNQNEDEVRRFFEQLISDLKNKKLLEQ